MTSVNQMYHPQLEQDSRRRRFNEVLVDLESREGFCNNTHCIYAQFLSSNGQAIPSTYCHGKEAADGCLVKRDALSLLPNSRDLVFQRVLATLKFEWGKFVGGEDIKSHGAAGIIRHLNLGQIFEESFNKYMERKIELDDVYREVVKGVDLKGEGARVAFNLNIAESSPSDARPGSFFG